MFRKKKRVTILPHQHSTTRSNTVKKYLLGACAIFHSEQAFLGEWIEFHLNQGFDRFYLYDNEHNVPGQNQPQDKYKHILEPYINKGQVVYHSWPDDVRQPNWTQRNAYYHCLQTFNNECQWIGFFDIDEFIFPDRTVTTFPNVQSIIRQYNANPRIAQISVIRYNFGNYWHKTPPPVGGVVENYRTRDKTFSNVKSFINTDCAYLHKPPDSVHIYKDLIKYGDSLNGETIPLPLRFNHYLTKSTDDFNNRNALWKKKRETSLFNPPDMCRFNNQLCPEDFNQVYDVSAIEFVPKKDTVFNKAIR